MMKPHLRYIDGRWWAYRNKGCTRPPTTARKTVKEVYQAHIQLLKYIEEL